MVPENQAMAQSNKERQQAFKAAQAAAGRVRVEVYITKEQRDKLAALGGAEWLRQAIDAAEVTSQKLPTA